MTRYIIKPYKYNQLSGYTEMWKRDISENTGKPVTIEKEVGGSRMVVSAPFLIGFEGTKKWRINNMEVDKFFTKVHYDDLPEDLFKL